MFAFYYSGLKFQQYNSHLANFKAVVKQLLPVKKLKINYFFFFFLLPKKLILDK